MRPHSPPSGPTIPGHLRRLEQGRHRAARRTLVLDQIAVDARVASAAMEGMLAFLDPARLGIGAVDAPGLLAIALHMLPGPGGAGDGGGPACTLRFQAALLQRAIDQGAQLQAQPGLNQVVAKRQMLLALGNSPAEGAKPVKTMKSRRIASLTASGVIPVM